MDRPRRENETGTNSNGRIKKNRKRAARRKLKNKIERNKLKRQSINRNYRPHEIGAFPHTTNLPTPKLIPMPPMFFTLAGSDSFIENYKRSQLWANTLTNANREIKALRSENGMLRKKVHQLTINWQTHVTQCPQFEPTVIRRFVPQQLRPIRTADDLNESTSSESSADEDKQQLISFLEKTANHQKQRDEFKRANDEAIPDIEQPSTSGMSDRGPNSEKDAMEKLYGEDAATILAMEKALQLNFERNVKKYKPPLWPCTALRNPHLRK